MNRLLLSIAVVFTFSLTLPGSHADESESKLKPVCPLSGKAISKDHTVAYKDAEVYFCCPNCPGAFKANTAKFAPKANHQLVVTEQAKQVKCPISGQPVDQEKTTKVAKLDVAFCCGNCLAKANKVDGDDRVKLVFADAAFKKGFEVKKDEE